MTICSTVMVVMQSRPCCQDLSLLVGHQPCRSRWSCVPTTHDQRSDLLEAQGPEGGDLSDYGPQQHSPTPGMLHYRSALAHHTELASMAWVRASSKPVRLLFKI